MFERRDSEKDRRAHPRSGRRATDATPSCASCQLPLVDGVPHASPVDCVSALRHQREDVRGEVGRKRIPHRE